MKKVKYLYILLLASLLASCDPYFWMGMMAGMMGMPAYNTYSTYPSYSPTYVPTYTPTVDWNSVPMSTTYYNYSEGVSTSSSTNTTSTSSSSSSSSSSRTCTKLSVSDIAHCNGTGICAKCNGKGKYYDNSFGLSNWVDPCVTCGGSGKCPSCHGTGKR